MADADAGVAALTEGLGIAREKYNAPSDAAEDSWVTMQDGVRESLASLRAVAESARGRLTEAKAELQ